MDKLAKFLFALFATPFILLAFFLILPFIALTVAAILTGVFILPLVVFFVLVPLFVLHGVYERSATGADRARPGKTHTYHVRWNA